MRFSDIDLIIYDFDGVMTDNRVTVDENGVEAVAVHRGDGLAIGLFKDQGIAQVIISKERNPVVSARGQKLGIPVLQGIDAKQQAVEAYVREHGLDLTRTMYVGNDINDLDAMQIVGHPVAPNDAHVKILDLARHVTAAKGGYGVVRELFDLFD